MKANQLQILKQMIVEGLSINTSFICAKISLRMPRFLRVIIDKLDSMRIRNINDKEK
jgi:hypothetical protein